MIDDVLIVVPCLNEALHIERVLRQCLETELPRHHLVVVADGGSTDGTLDILNRLTDEFPSLRILHNRRKLQSAGVNLAVDTYAEGFRYLLRVDAHADYPKNYLKRLGEEMLATGAQSVVVPLISEGQTWFQKAVAMAQNSVLGTGGSPHRHEGRRIWVDHGHHALFDIAWFKMLGGYNPAFGYNEDAEFDIRLGREGGKVWLAGDVPVIYYPRRNLVALCVQYYSYGGGRAKTVQLHKTRLKPRQMAPLAIAPACIAALFSLAFPSLWPLALPAIVWALVACAFGAYLAIRHGEPCALASGPAAMAMHLSWSVGYWRRSSLFSLFNRRPPNAPADRRSGQKGKPESRPNVKPKPVHGASSSMSVRDNASTSLLSVVKEKE